MLHLKVNGDLSSKSTVAVYLCNGAAYPAQRSTVRVHNLHLAVNLALIFDGILDF